MGDFQNSAAALIKLLIFKYCMSLLSWYRFYSQVPQLISNRLFHALQASELKILQKFIRKLYLALI